MTLDALHQDLSLHNPTMIQDIKKLHKVIDILGNPEHRSVALFSHSIDAGIRNRYL